MLHTEILTIIFTKWLWCRMVVTEFLRNNMFGGLGLDLELGLGLA